MIHVTYKKYATITRDKDTRAFPLWCLSLELSSVSALRVKLYVFMFEVRALQILPYYYLFLQHNLCLRVRLRVRVAFARACVCVCVCVCVNECVDVRENALVRIPKLSLFYFNTLQYTGG